MWKEMVQGVVIHKKKNIFLYNLDNKLFSI